jgi:CBS domain-containing protein
MTSKPSTCRLETPLDEASRLMDEAHCGTLVVLDQRGHPVGIVTDRDLAISIGRITRPPSEVSARDVMKSPLHVCRPEESIVAALERMADAQVRRLPVVSRRGALKGIVSIDDIVLWGLQHDGVTRKELLRALRAVCAANETLSRTDNLDELIVAAPEID